MLSPRETVVLDLLCEGKTDKDIARRLGVEVTTVRTYVRLVKAKLDVETRAQAILKYDRLKR